MMQHQEQESRQTLPRPRFLHEPLAAISNTIREMQVHGASPADVVAYALAAIDAQAQEDRKRLVASLDALSEAIRNDTGWVGGFAPDQWELIETAIRAAWLPTELLSSKPRQYSSLNDFTAEVRRNLEQQNGGSPL